MLSATVVGIVYGCIYALAASGLVVTYQTSGVFNFAHGAIGMIAAWTYWQMAIGWGWPAPVALAVALLVIAPLFGIAIERVLIRPLHGAAVDTTVVVTLGLLLSLIGLAFIVWDQQQIRQPYSFLPTVSFNLLGFNVNGNQITVMVAAIAVAAGLRLFFNRTRMGIAMRGVVDNPDLVAMAGGRPVRVQQLAWALGVSLASLAGILLASLLQLTVLQLTLSVTFGYAAAMVGQLRSLPMTVGGGLLLGLLVSYASQYNYRWLTEVKLIIPMILLFVVLVVLAFVGTERLRVSTISASRPPNPATLTSSVLWGVVLVGGAGLVSGHLSPANLNTFNKGWSIGFILLSLTLLTGYGGLTSLCQMTFAGLGAFAMGHLGHGGSWVGVLAAIGFAAAWGFLLGLPTLRLRGLYLALATLAFAYAFDEVFFNNAQILGTGGSIDVARIDVPGVPGSDRAYFVVLAAFFALGAIGVLAVRRGRFGRRLAALDDSPAACATLGLNINWTRLVVFTASAGMAGLGGVLYGGAQGQVGPNDFAALISLLILLQLRAGGVNTATGAFLGAMFFAGFAVLQQSTYVADHPALGSVQFLLTGLAAIAVSRRPNGPGGEIAHAAAWLRARLAARGEPPGGPEGPSVSTAEQPELARA